MSEKLITIRVLLQDRLRAADVEVLTSDEVGLILREALIVFDFDNVKEEGAAIRDFNRHELLPPNKSVAECNLEDYHVLELLIGLRELR